jgi:YMGG-like Gly-zipper
MRLYLSVAALLGALILASCAKQAAGGPHATVTLRDGTTVSGNVFSSSASEIQLAGDDKTSHSIPMSQVRTVEYGDPQSAQTPGTPAGSDADDHSHDNHQHPVEAAITTRTYELPPGTQISVRNEETIDSGRAAEGQRFAAEVTQGVRDGAGDVVVPRGSNAQIVIKSASKGGHFRGASDLVLDLASVSVDGRMYQLSTRDVAERGRNGVGANKRTAEFAGGGAAVGAIIGAIAGHGKGAAIGAGSGAGAGALTEILTKGTIKVPVESVLTFKLDQPLRVVAAQ